MLKDKKNFAKKLFIFTIIFSDIFSVFLAFIVSYFLRNVGIFRIYLDSVQPIDVYLRALPFAIILLLCIFNLAALYEPKKRVNTVSEMYVLIQAITIWILLIMAGSYLTKFDYSRIVVVIFYIFTIIFAISGRIIIRILQFHFSKNGFGRVNILIIGAGKPARSLARRLEVYQDIGFRLIGFIDDKALEQEHILGGLEKLNKILKNHNIDEVYIADPTLSHEQILTIVAKCPYPNIKFKIISNVFDLITGYIDVANLDSIPSLDIGKIHNSWWKNVYRRIFDITIAIIGIIITFPLCLIISILIKFDSSGRALFVQKRVGQNGKVFSMYKFRTMQKESMAYYTAPRHKNDERITRIGKFLRRYSLDELPQLINVIKGEMSIIGPRPEMQFVVKKYSQWEKRRLLVKPGLTGLWQILGRKNLPLSENMEYDFYYINNQSLLLDIVIILKTIPVVLFGKGAY